MSGNLGEACRLESVVMDGKQSLWTGLNGTERPGADGSVLTGAERVSGTGEMADLVRRHPWAETGLGAIAAWPETLLAMVNMMLAAEMPLQLFWGPEMITFYNDALRPAFAEKHPAAMGRPGREVWSEVWGEVGSQLEDVLRHGKAVSFRAVPLKLRRNGVLEQMYWDYSYSPVLAPGGEIVGVLDVSVDVTETVLAQEQRRALAEQLRQVLHATTDSVMGVNRQGRITYTNPRAETLYGRMGPLVGRTMAEALPDSLVEGSPFLAHNRLGMEEGVASKYEAFYPEPLNLWLGMEVYPTEDGIVVFSRDISEQKRAMQALLQTEKLAAVGRLAASIAHEINNPLESVTNLLYLARRTQDPVELQEYLATAERELRRVSVISSQTLRFYKQSTNPVEVRCQELFESVLSIYQGRLVNSRVTVEKRKRAIRKVECFDGEIRQVLNNLVGNAIDAMHPQGGRLLVRSREATNWRTGKHGVVLTVADTGHGMTPMVLKRAFEAFYTTKGIGGTGLGLWVSLEIVQRHGGSLTIRSSQREGGSGTVCALFLPLTATER